MAPRANWKGYLRLSLPLLFAPVILVTAFFVVCPAGSAPLKRNRG